MTIYKWYTNIGDGTPGWKAPDGTSISHGTGGGGGGGGTTPPPQGWTLIFSDEFTGTSIDTTKWNVHNGSVLTDASYSLPANVAVANGSLVITAKKQAVADRLYTSGYIDTVGKFTLPATNWRHEMRAKVPLELGMWAAPVWFRNNSGGAGEIDTVETYGGQPGSAFQTLHTAYSNDIMAHASVAWRSLANPNPLDWHTYITEKTPGSIKISVDEITREFTPANYSQFTSFYDVGTTWNIRCNLQVGAGTGGAASGDPSDPSVDWTKTQMVVDYHRVYKLTGT